MRPIGDDDNAEQCAVVCGMQAAEGGNLEAGHMSDATASGPASDDEASSMAATVGSMLHTSPADREGSGAGSDSGGSQVDSVSGMICSLLFSAADLTNIVAICRWQVLLDVH